MQVLLFWQVPCPHGFSQTGILHVKPFQPDAHWHVRFCVHMPLTHDGEHTGIVHWSPPQPAWHPHLLGFMQEPWLHENSQIGKLHAVPFQPALHLQVALSSERTPFTQDTLAMLFAKILEISVLTCGSV
jgi:hypothetical protein